MGRRSIEIALVTFTSWFCAGPGFSEQNPVIAAYFMQWGIYDQNYHVTNIPAHMITHVNYAFARPAYYPSSNTAALVSMDTNADMEIMYPGDTNGQPLKGSFNQLIKLKQHFPHVRTLISAGGWNDSDAFSDICDSGNARTAFVHSCVAFITSYGFDGIDFDWEYPVEGGEDGLSHRPEDDDNFLLLVQEMRALLDQQEALDGKDYLVTIAASADYNSLTSRYRIAEMSSALDWINVMTYDLAGPWDSHTGHNSPLYGNPAAPNPNYNVHTSVQTFLSNGVAAGKLVVGMPFYGRGFKGVPSTSNGLFQTNTGASARGSWEAGVFDFKDLLLGTRTNQYINANGFTRHWDAAAAVPYLYNPTSQIFITYDDETSIGLKVDYALSHGLAGVMFWSVDGDTEGCLLQAGICRACYPFSAQTAATQDSNAAVRLSWHGFTGQQHTVEFSPDLLAGVWSNCTTLVDTSGVPFASAAGADARIVALDTSFPALSRGFYRTRMTNTNTPP